MQSKPHVVIIGGGFAGLNAAKRLRRVPVRITLLDRSNHHLFQPLLYQVALSALSPAEIAAPIRHIVRKQKNLQVLLSEVSAVDLENKRLALYDGEPLDYDYLILAAGVETNYFGHDDWSKVALGLKDIDDAIEIRRRVLLAYEQAEREPDAKIREALMTFVVIGGGPTGVELAGAIAELGQWVLDKDFRRINPQLSRVILLEGGERILTPFVPSLSESAVKQLKAIGVEVRCGARVTDIDDEGVHLGDEFIPAWTTLWAAGVKASPLAGTLGVELDRQDRVVISQDCGIACHPEAFAIGDIASFVPEGEEQALPGISPVAIQQAEFVARTISADIKGAPRASFRYRDKGIMATIGRSRAVAQTRRFRFSGFFAWMAWLLVHIWFLIGFRNRFIVVFSWFWSYLTFKRGARLITGSCMHPRLRKREEARGGKTSRSCRE